MSDNSTVTTDSLGWTDDESVPKQPIPHLIIAWSRDEPHRIGEAAPIERTCMLGRGFEQNDDPAPRVSFFKIRPIGTSLMPPLQSSRVSRLQLRLAPLPNGQIALSSVGRCPVLVNGAIVSTATVVPGDIITLRNAMIFQVAERPFKFDAPRAGLAGPAFPFGSPDPHGIIGESPATWALRDALAFAAQGDSHVLVQGPSGAGKELAARAIHALSNRRDGAFVSRNAATFPEGLVDAEFFGSAKGYPNQGMAERPGLIGEADNGTLFLDEIGELSPQIQAHLLRVMDKGGEYQRLGDARVRRSNLRLVAATNRPIDTLKHDFAARFSVRLVVSGLSERREDIPLLVRHLLDLAAASRPDTMTRFLELRPGTRPEPRIEPALIEALLQHPYTYHMRELERLLMCASATSPGQALALTSEVEAELRGTTPLTAQIPSETVPVARQSRAELFVAEDAIEKAEIEAALSVARGKITVAARRLGLKNRYALYRLMKRHGIVQLSISTVIDGHLCTQFDGPASTRWLPRPKQEDGSTKYLLRSTSFGLTRYVSAATKWKCGVVFTERRDGLARAS